MIVLDTNVASELIAVEPNPRVVDWLKSQDPADLYLTSICKAELLFGVQLLPVGRRRKDLTARLTRLIELFGTRILGFDSTAAIACSQLAAKRRLMGRPILFPDAQIAAICLVHQATLATRNTADFAECGLALIDPWRTDPSVPSPSRPGPDR